MKRKRASIKEKDKEEPIETNGTQEDSDSDEGLFKYPGTISRAQSLKMIQQLEELSESSSDEDARDVIAKRLKTMGKSKKKLISSLSKKSLAKNNLNDKSQPTVNKVQELDNDDDDLDLVPVIQPKIMDIVNSNADIKKSFEILRKSEQVVKSYRTTSNLQIDEISNTDNDEVIIDEIKTKESQKTKPHRDEDALHTDSIITNNSTTTTAATSSSRNDQQNNESKGNDFVLLIARLDDDIIKFKLRRTDPLQKLLDGFCQKKNLEKAKTRLLFDGFIVDLEKNSRRS